MTTGWRRSMGRILALDVGSKRIGVAVSDELEVLATPRGAIQRRDRTRDLAAIERLIEETEAERVIVGQPLGMSGTATAETHRVEAFAGLLSSQVLVPVEMWDERLTTSMATAITGNDPRTRRSGRRDAVAAAILLQDYLDHRRAGPEGTVPSVY